MIAESGFGRTTLKAASRLRVLVTAVLAAAGCEEITNPIEEFGQLGAPYVRFEFPEALGTPGAEILVIFQLSTRVQEDVEIDFTFGGDAVFGEDFLVLDDAGNPRGDVSASGGTATIPYDFERTLFGRDTLGLFVPLDATGGRTLEIEIVAAVTSSGRSIETGYIDSYRRFTMQIEGYIQIPEGTYVGQRTGELGTANAIVTINRAAQPIQVNDEAFLYELSDLTGDGILFGVPMPWSFNVTSGGSALVASASHVYAVSSDVTGTYDFETNTLSLDVILTCYGGEGLTWSLAVTLQ